VITLANFPSREQSVVADIYGLSICGARLKEAFWVGSAFEEIKEAV
jgi:hypothetical protein